MKQFNMKIEGNVFVSEWCYQLGCPDMHLLNKKAMAILPFMTKELSVLLKASAIHQSF